MKRWIVAAFTGLAMIVSGCGRVKERVPGPTVAPDEAGAPPIITEAPSLKLPLTNDGSWKVSASSVERPEFGPEKAVDGDFSTRWSSQFENAQWWQVDFGQLELLNAISIFWEDAYARMFYIELSQDGQTWQTIYSERSGSGGTSMVRFSPQPARYVRVYCDVRATPFGFSFFEVQFNCTESPEITVTASSGSGEYAPRYALDGNSRTRWSSEFRDGEWWQAEFRTPRTLSGMKILWETAFAEKYAVQTSDDGRNWKTIYNVAEGDGQTDILFWAPVTTRFVRLHCIQRGTGWGNSIWEITIFDKPASACAQSAAEGYGPERAVDGNEETAWRSEGVRDEWWAVELPDSFDLGGIELTWGPRYATEYDVEVSSDGQTWDKMYREEFGNGGRDYIFFPSRRARWVRIVCRRSADERGFELAHLELKSGEEQVTPLRAYQAAARNAPRGRYPMWLRREQEFWTVVGLPDDDQESLIGETGTVEPFKGGFSVQPFVVLGTQIVTWADVKVSQRLEDDYLPLPSVQWKGSGWKLEISAVTVGEPGAAHTAVRYRLSNTTARPVRARLVLAVRPIQLNPIWQHGGLSRIDEAEYVAEGAMPRLRINNRAGLLLATRPDKVGVSPLSNGDVTDFLDRGMLPDITLARDTDGKVGAGLEYRLDVEPSAYKDVVVLLPLHSSADVSEVWGQTPEVAFESAWSEARSKWTDLLHLGKIEIPEKRLTQVLKSNLAYILINHDSPWLKPGSRNYNHGWMRDGALTGEAMLRLGRADLVKSFILNFHRFVNDEGWVPFMIMEDGRPCGFNPNKDGGEGHEFDSQGQFVFIVRRYYDFTKDQDTLRAVYPSIVRALKYGRAIRKMRMADKYRDTEYWGILPHSNSHEGYFPAKHSYWDDFWMLRGLKDGAWLAEALGRSEDAAWMREEEQDLRRCLLISIDKVVQRGGLNYVPGCVELSDEDPTSTSIAVITCDEGAWLPSNLLYRTFDRYQSRIEKRYRGVPDSFTPYEARNAEVFARLGQRERALALIRYLANDSTRPRAWNHLAEVVHADYRAASYIGDMPHTWVGSDLINAMISLFVYEDRDSLVLGAGLDPAWASEGITVADLPTAFGAVAYRVARDGDHIEAEVTGTAAPPKGFVWALPDAWREGSFALNGEPVSLEGGNIRFSRLPAQITVTLPAPVK